MVADGQFEPPATFHGQEESSYSRPGPLVAEVDPVFASEGDGPHGILRVITLDGYAALHQAVAQWKAAGTLPRRVQVQSSKYLNNVIEQDHRRIKQRIRPMKLWPLRQAPSSMPTTQILSGEAEWQAALFEGAEAVGAQGHAEPVHQALPGTPSQGVTDRADDLAESSGLLSVRCTNFCEPFGEDVLLASRVAAPPAIEVQPEAYRRALDGQVSQARPVIAVTRACHDLLQTDRLPPQAIRNRPLPFQLRPV